MITRIPQTLFNLWRSLSVREAEKRRRADYAALFRTPVGQTVLADMIMTSGFLAADPPHTDPCVIAHRNGARWLMGEILRTAGVEPEPLATALIHDDLSEALHHD